MVRISMIGSPLSRRYGLKIHDRTLLQSAKAGRPPLHETTLLGHDRLSPSSPPVVSGSPPSYFSLFTSFA
jgi:hypothetical protein